MFYCSSVYFHYVKGTHWECFVNRLFVLMVSRVLIGDYLVNCIFVSMSRVLIGSVLLIVCIFRLCQGYSLGVSCKSSIFLHGVMGTNWGLSCQLSFCFHVTGTHWECFVNRLYILIMSRVLIGSVL